jgi:flagellar assembly factor FliW
MATLACPDLGQFEFQDEDIISFPEGVPAFEALRRFLLLRKEEYAPFVFLASVDLPAVRFICVPVCLLDPDYRFELAAGEGAAAGLADGVYAASSGDLVVLAIVTLPNSAPATANLASPVVLNARLHLGAQLILPAATHSYVTPLRPWTAVEGSC